MKRIVSLLLAVVMLISLTVGVFASNDFDYLIKNKIIEGKKVEGGKLDLALEDEISRAEIAKIIVMTKESLGESLKLDEMGFKDVKKGSWADSFIRKAKAAGYINGRGDGNFYPQDKISIQEVVAIVSRAILGSGQLEWPKGYIDFANKNSLLDDIKGDLKEKANRGQAFTILEKAVNSLNQDKNDEYGNVKFVDDLGRNIVLPKKINRVGALGHPSSKFVYAIAPEKLVGWSSNTRPEEEKYYQAAKNVASWGAYFGKKSNFNKETALKQKPDLLVDLGQIKNKPESMIADIERLEDDINIPVIFLKGDIEDIKSSALKLGKLLGEEVQAEAIAKFYDQAFSMAKKSKNKKTFYFGDGKSGLNTNHAGNTQQKPFEMVGMVNVIKLNDKRDVGGNEVAIESLLKEDPDVLIFHSGSIADKVKDMPIWKNLRAVKEGQVYEIPYAGVTWMGRPSSVNQLLGLVFASYINEGKEFDQEFKNLVIDFYKIFMHYDMSDKEANDIISKIKK